MPSKQGGDRVKLARPLVSIADREAPPLRFIAAADSFASSERKIVALQEQIAALRELSTSLAFDDV